LGLPQQITRLRVDAFPGLHALRVGLSVGSISGNSGLSNYTSLLFWNIGAAQYGAGGVEVMIVVRYHAQTRSRFGGVVFLWPNFKRF